MREIASYCDGDLFTEGLETQNPASFGANRVSCLTLSYSLGEDLGHRGLHFRMSFVLSDVSVH